MAGNRANELVAETKTSGGALGLGLMALGGIVGALILLWLAVSAAGGQLNAGGAVLGLILLALLALPPIVAGWFLRQRGRQEALDMDQMVARRAIIDADTQFRRRLSRELTQRLSDLEPAVRALPPTVRVEVETAQRRLRDVARMVAQPGYTAASLMEDASISAEIVATVRRYDDLVLEQVERLADLQSRLASESSAAAYATAVTQLAQHVREREDVLARGRRAAALSPQELLAAGATPRRRVDSPLALQIDDAVTVESADYLVRADVHYFAGGREWRSYQLRDGQTERWLEVRSGQMALLEPLPATELPGGESLERDGVTYRQRERGTATVDITGAAGTATGVFVEYRRLASDAGTMLVLETWPDGPRLLRGGPVAPEDLQLWTKPPVSQ